MLTAHLFWSLTPHNTDRGEPIELKRKERTNPSVDDTFLHFLHFNSINILFLSLSFQIRSEQPYYSADNEVDSLVSIKFDLKCNAKSAEIFSDGENEDENGNWNREEQWLTWAAERARDEVNEHTFAIFSKRKWFNAENAKTKAKTKGKCLCSVSSLSRRSPLLYFCV